MSEVAGEDFVAREAESRRGFPSIEIADEVPSDRLRWSSGSWSSAIRLRCRDPTKWWAVNQRIPSGGRVSQILMEGASWQLWSRVTLVCHEDCGDWGSSRQIER